MARTNNWTLEIYPGDSAVENWQEILSDELKLIWCASPVHEFDTKQDGTLKKPHIHIVLFFNGKKSFEQIQEIADKLFYPSQAWLDTHSEQEIGHGPRPEPVNNTRGMVRYLIHLDDPQKYQYKKEEIINHGADIEQYFGWSSSEITEAKQKIKEFVIENNITEFDDLVQACMNFPLWAMIIEDRNTSFFKAWLYNRAMIAKKKTEELIKAQKILTEVSEIEARIQECENKYIKAEKGI